MRLREFFVTTLVMVFAFNTLAAWPRLRLTAADDLAETDEARPEASLPAAPSTVIMKDRALGSAYHDALSILSTPGPCSDFFGGSAIAVEVFNGFMAAVTKGYFVRGIGMRMSGSVTNVVNAASNKQYRLFEKVSINMNGPFYRRKTFTTDPFMSRIGSFEANSPEVRVLMLLHELGHLIKSPDGNWLLPDDGHDEDLSRQNSQTIEALCGEQIKHLGAPQDRINLVTKKKASQKTVALNTTTRTPR